ncbi:methionine--tRNA ligase subunit beta, partial [candidate division TM6 bacterium RIFCSPHIGHO2_12_FULL_32_22]
DLSATNFKSLNESLWNQKYNLQEVKMLFKKIEPSEEIKSETLEINYINIDDFAKIDLLVGEIKECQEVEGSEKLLRLQVDFGPHGTRQIFSGIKEWVKPLDLIDKKAVFVFNLKPRKMMGSESQGMLLAVSDENNNVRPIFVPDNIRTGTKLK